MGRESFQGLKKFFNLPLLVLKARHQAPNALVLAIWGGGGGGGGA